MLEKDIFERLKGGSIKKIALFGNGVEMPKPPYVVIKTEAGEGVKNIRLIVHFNQGEQERLENYLFEELTELMKGFNFNRRFSSAQNEWTGIILGNDDGTIAGERVFTFPWLVK
jgi:hypothetical protein